ncbi:Na+/H+ antiporter NhaC family protein [Peribacillus kribbensis]|uniref:Na+/H+ antiporter NhaC family protein n=1 Tax=Peribacillus kribbensis TaxID=356658 RepID=UPI0003FEB2C0|nr:Na+/H+ antiporter NhaC family protein [Peribacillus kribbensis]
MEGNWVSVVPFLIVIPLSILTKQVLAGLFAGFLAGSYLLSPSLTGGLDVFIRLLVKGMVDENNIKIILFLYMFSGLIGIIKISGGVRGFVEKASERIHTKKEALILTYLSTLGTFTAPSFRFVTIAPIMRALLQKVNMSAQELGFVIETTATPIIVLIPIATAFVGYMTSMVDAAVHAGNVSLDPYRLFIQSIPFNFFSFVMIIVGIYLSFFHRSRSTENSDPNQIGRNTEGGDDWHSCDPSVNRELPVKPWNLLAPLALIIILTMVFTWWSGYQKNRGIVEAFLNADVMAAMLAALLAVSLLTFVWLLFQRFTLNDLIGSFIQGGNEMVSVIVLLSIVWGLSSVAEKLGFAAFITQHTGWIPSFFVVPVLFLFGGALSYFIGSAWGTWGILMPMGISMAQAAGISLPIMIGAVFASGTFGAFASPLSDDTNTLARILNISVIEYARFKLKPALIAAGITALLYAGTVFLPH